MAVRADQLPALLEQSLAPVYLVAGAEPLLVQECRDLILQAAQREGFSERNVYEAGKGFDWQRLGEDSATLSLFSSRKIVDVRLPTGRPGREGAEAFLERLDAGDPDVLLLITCEKWEASQRKAKWASEIARAGVLVEVWPVKPQQLPQWIRKRMVAVGLEPEADAVSMLADLVEGNLLAAQQEIDKLLLLDQGPRISAADVNRAVANSARFDAFRLVESVLAGRLGDCLRVAAGLQRTDVAIQLVCGALYRELMLADSVRMAVQAGENEQSVFGRLRIWPARQAPMRQALRRLAAQAFDDAFSALALIDRQSKGRAAGDPWQTLDQLLCFLCDPTAAQPPLERR
jgi:DNA polymerase-3 subunit delta